MGGANGREITFRCGCIGKQHFYTTGQLARIVISEMCKNHNEVEAEPLRNLLLELLVDEIDAGQKLARGYVHRIAFDGLTVLLACGSQDHKSVFRVAFNDEAFDCPDCTKAWKNRFWPED